MQAQARTGQSIVGPSVFDIDFPVKLQFLFRRKGRYKVARGGRGAAKSWGFARALLLLGTQSPLRILCAREVQKSIADSVHQLLCDQIAALGLQKWYKITDTQITGKNGTTFIFAGLLRNINNIKSLEGVDIVWIEEAEKVSKVSWRKLIPTIRKAGSQIWVTYNPDEEDDPTHKKFGSDNPADWPPDCEVIEMNWWDNPWFPEELRKEMEYDYKVDPDTAAHVWEGKCNSRSDAQILRGKWIVEAFESHPTWDGPYFGQDFGFGPDPAATTKSWIWEKKLFIEYEAGGHGLKNNELNSVIRTIPGAASHVIRADCSRPETIAHLSEDFGLNMVGCKKWEGCVEDGIQYLRSFEQIIVHPRCVQTKKECRLYKYKIDRVTGDILAVVADRWNHYIDSLRYAHEPAILRMMEEMIVVDGAPDEQGISQELDEAEVLGPEFSVW
jgi:phage terminase large subunit